MALRLTSAFTDGVRRVLTRTGGILFALLFAYQLVLLASLNTLIDSALPSDAGVGLGFTLPVSGTVAGGLLIGSLVFATAYFVVLTRAFARPVAELSTFPAELYTRRMGLATLWMFVGGVVVFVAVTIGLAFLLLPGLFLSACFLFFIFAVGVEDRGPVGSLGRSWDLSRGNRLRLVLLVFLMGVGSAAVSVVPTLLDLAGASVLGDFASVVLNSVLFIFVYGITAAAYLQVADDGAGDGRSGTSDASSASSSSAELGFDG